MQNACTIALAGLLALSAFLTPGDACAWRKKKILFSPEKHQTTLAYAMQTPRVRANCFPGRLRAILSHIARQTGRRPVVTSGHRPRAHRRGSYHRRCMAADIRVPGVSSRRIVAIAHSAPGIGGIGTYCSGIVHVDVGPKRRWSHC